MKLCIHRGTHQIGGVAAEISTASTRILIDMGDELSLDPNFVSAPLNIPGVTNGNGHCDAVLFTHYHGDHTGQMLRIRPEIPIYAGALAKDIMRLSAERGGQKNEALCRRIETIQTFSPGKPFLIGDIQITPFCIDHSACDSYKVERPKKDRYVGSFYDADEVNALFEAAKGTKLELPILFGAFYGLRRSEAIGLKWDAIDFEQNTITIRHTVTSCDLDGKRVLVASDTTKTKSSMRTLPLVPFMRERLLSLKEEQQENRRLCGRSYIKDYIGYVCVNEIGDLIKPHYVTESFPKLLKANGLRHIRYHDLRHSCASLLLANGVPMKQIQEWLGHSDFSTTANIYAHLDYSSKLTSADAMLNGLGLAPN